MAEIPSKPCTGAGDTATTEDIAQTTISADLQQPNTTSSNANPSLSNYFLMIKIAKHLKKNIQRFEESNSCPRIVVEYLKNSMVHILEDIKSGQNKEIVEYIFAPEDRNQLKRDRLNSCSISLDTCIEALSKLNNTDDMTIELPSDMPDATIHYCTDCEAEIPLIDNETSRGALLRHFTNDPHKPQPKPEVVLPTMSRKMAAMLKAEPAGKESDMLGESEKFKLKLAETLTIFDAGQVIDAEGLIAIYKDLVTVLTTKVSVLDLSIASKVITPILVSIKDNVNQSSIEAARVNDEEEEGLDDPNAKNEPKRLKFYQPIATKFDEFIAKHKLISLVDERGGRPAYFCIPCEFYTLRFGYETVIAHILSDTHIQHLSELLAGDGHILHTFANTGTPQEIQELNRLFLSNEMWISNYAPGLVNASYLCRLCRVPLLDAEMMLNHIFDESHMGKVSGKIYFKMKDDKDVKWGQKNVDWKKFNMRNGIALTPEQPIVLENFVKPLAKTLSQCQCCTLMLKGQRQLVFNHVRQKKHIRNAIPRRLTIAFSNFVRPLEFFSSLGHFYTCTLCETFPQSVMLNFSDIFDHYESDDHVTAVAKLLRVYGGNFSDQDTSCLMRQGIEMDFCMVCGLQFETLQDVIGHIFTDVEHQNHIAAREYVTYKPHIANYLLNSTPIALIDNNYQCMACDVVMTTTSALLAHLSLADHIPDKLQPEAVFRYYLLLKNNAKICKENLIFVRDQNIVECQKCNSHLEPDENVRCHITSVKHKG